MLPIDDGSRGPILPLVSDSPSEINRRAAALRPTLYPELEHEDLPSLVRRLVAMAGYPLEGLAAGRDFHVADRFAQVTCAALERLFLFDLWSKSVSYGACQTDDPRAMADAIGAFVIGRLSVDEMSTRFPWIRFYPTAREHEAGRLVEARWRSYLEAKSELGELLRSLVEACARRPRLRALFPFTSHETLLFSRTTGYPYDSMAACARPVYEPSSTRRRYVDSFVPGLFEVLVRDSGEPLQPSSTAPRSLGKSDAEWAAAALEHEVPPTWHGAIDGTRDDVGLGA
jgi:hypothetical protein